MSHTLYMNHYDGFAFLAASFLIFCACLLTRESWSHLTCVAGPYPFLFFAAIRNITAGLFELSVFVAA